MKKFTEVVLVLAILLFTGSAVLGQANNNPPPAGAILDLSGTPIPHGTYKHYTVDFIAQLDQTAISFAFREDPSFEAFTNSSVTDNADPNSLNLLHNGDFSQGTHTDDNGHAGTPNSWTYTNQYGATFSGVVHSGPGACGSYNSCWYDGSVEAYDLISQLIPTTVGHTYHISFFLIDYSGQANFSEVRTATAQGINVTAYAQGGLPAVQSAQTVNVQFSPNPNPQTQIATVGDPASPAAQSLALTLSGVTTALNVSETFFYEPTELSAGITGVGIADGICEAGATETQDFDCRSELDFTYQVLPNGDKVVPHIIPSHNFMGVWIRVVATRVSDGQPAVAGVDYALGVDWYYAWNTNPALAPGGFLNPGASGGVNPEYPTGWNNLSPQMYDRPGENVNIDFVKNITTYSKNCAPSCVGTADPGVGAHTITLNDIVAAAPPNPPVGTALGTVTPVVPVPGISPFPYNKTLPMLVAFKLADATTGAPITNAVTPPHSVHVATLDPTGNNVPVQFPQHFPTTVTYNPNSKTYFIYLSPTPYKTDGTVYTLEITSDLFPQPFTASFVVK
jgi:hypothetical protein